jgi:hypothetical protein
LAAEQAAGYRHGIWGGTTPGRRERIAASLPTMDFTEAYAVVLEAWAAR